MAKKINYNTRTFDEYKEQLKDFTRKYYPTIINDFNDASIGQFFIDLNAAVADNIGYHTDRMFQETQLDFAQERRSLFNIARTNGFRIGGKRPSVVEAKWSCFVPALGNNPDYSYAPIIHKGTQASGGGQKFELLEDLNFRQQFNSSGVSDREFIPVSDSNGRTIGYTIHKYSVMTSTESKIFKYPVSSFDVKPFMEIVLPESNVTNIQSILIKEGYDNETPSSFDFLEESDDRWYEVGSLIEDKIFVKDLVMSKSFADTLIDGIPNVSSGYTTGNTYYATMADGSVVCGFIPSIGKWKTMKRKFITEYTDKGYCKIIFGSGVNSEDVDGSTYYNASDFARYQLNNIINNENLGQLPPTNSTIYVYYSIGGGSQSNIAANTMTGIPYLNISINGSDQSVVNTTRNSITVTNTIPSVSGRDELSNDEVRYLIKYNNASQDRCVTIKDYHNRIMTMPTQFGAPFKIGVSEKNNKILITMLGLTYDGKLSQEISKVMVDNISEYLSEYKMINDYVEIQPGKILNLEFQIDVTIDSNQQQQDVAKEIALYVGDYLDINNHKLGQEIYVSKMKSHIAGISGVKNLIDLKVFNLHGGQYSPNVTKQSVVMDTTRDIYRSQINLNVSDGVLYSDDDTMFEIKHPKTDIIINAKYR